MNGCKTDHHQLLHKLKPGSHMTQLCRRHVVDSRRHGRRSACAYVNMYRSHVADTKNDAVSDCIRSGELTQVQLTIGRWDHCVKFLDCCKSTTVAIVKF